MSAYVPFLVFGLVVGSIYGLAAMGLVLTYRTSGIFNFGHGAVGAGSAYVFYELRQRQGMPWPLAGLIAVVAFGVVLGVLLERIARGLATVPVSYQIVGTVGLLVLIRAVATWIYGADYRLFKPFLPHHSAFTLSGVAVTQESVIIFLAVSVAAVGLYVLVERSRLGTMMRAVDDDPALLDTNGIAPARIRRQAWLLGSVLRRGVRVYCWPPSNNSWTATLPVSLLVVQAFEPAAIRRIPQSRRWPMQAGSGSASHRSWYRRRRPPTPGSRGWTSICRSWCCSWSCWCSGRTPVGRSRRAGAGQGRGPEPR